MVTFRCEKEEIGNDRSNGPRFSSASQIQKFISLTSSNRSFIVAAHPESSSETREAAINWKLRWGERFAIRARFVMPARGAYVVERFARHFG
jgi:hypothetical protein